MPKTPRNTVTLKHVAERVGVTSAAVSMALSDSTRISEKTKQAVRRAAEELGYVPSSVGRALRNQRAEAIALIVPNTSRHVFGHSYFMHVLTGVSSAANGRDMQVVLSTTSEGADDAAAYARVVRSHSADGAIVTSASISDASLESLVDSGLPVVLIGNFPYLPDAVTVGIDDVGASGRITQHLIAEHGRARLVHVTGPLDHQTGIDRLDGFQGAVDAAGIGADCIVIEGDFSEESGRAAMQQALDGPTPFDGVVFANDDMAFGGLQELKARGIQVPQEVAIVGFDDFGLSRLTTPGITTVHAPAEEMARLATEHLIEVIDGRASGSFRRELPVHLVVRESCGCPSL